MGRMKAIAGLVALAVLGVVLYVNVVRPNLVPKNFGVVDQGHVYRSGQLTPSAMRRVCEREHIKTVIDLGSYWDGATLTDPRGDARNQRMAEAMGVTRYVMPLVGDGTGNANWYVHALRIMNDPSKQPVLVHCGAGSERTGVASILYEQLRTGKPDNAEGEEQARQYRHSPRRNPHFREVLDKYGAEILRCVRGDGQLTEFDPIPTPKPVPKLGAAS
jgi:protein tyrosine/serine phosphatase